MCGKRSRGNYNVVQENSSKPFAHIWLQAWRRVLAKHVQQRGHASINIARRPRDRSTKEEHTRDIKPEELQGKQYSLVSRTPQSCPAQRPRRKYAKYRRNVAKQKAARLPPSPFIEHNYLGSAGSLSSSSKNTKRVPGEKTPEKLARSALSIPAHRSCAWAFG